MLNNKPKLIVILGPTASGKTDLAIKLAKKFNGEIVSADSRLVYKEMNIGTAKPKKDKGKEYLVKGVPHYLINNISLKEDYNVALFKKQAVEAIDKIIKKGNIPFLVGGTGLYIKAVVENLDFPALKQNKKLRKELDKKDAEELFSIYQKLDKEGSSRIDKNNKRRLIRAIEVVSLLKEPFFKERKGEKLYNVLQLGIKIKNDELEKNINKRVDQMIRDGLEKEVKKLSKIYSFKKQPLQTIGYREWQDYFNKKITKKEAIELIKKNTIKFAKRQMTWFKKDKTIKWIKKEGCFKP